MLSLDSRPFESLFKFPKKSLAAQDLIKVMRNEFSICFIASYILIATREVRPSKNKFGKREASVTKTF